jgi:hypothetical protein
MGPEELEVLVNVLIAELPSPQKTFAFLFCLASLRLLVALSKL